MLTFFFPVIVIVSFVLFYFFILWICCDRYAITELMKQKNRMPFGKEEETSLGKCIAMLIRT
jgi:Prp31 C terminal domain